MSKIEIRQVDGEKGVFTEILIDGHKLNGVRKFELKHCCGDLIPTLTIDLNAFELSTDMKYLKVNQECVGEIESIKFRHSDKPFYFGK